MSKLDKMAMDFVHVMQKEKLNAAEVLGVLTEISGVSIAAIENESKEHVLEIYIGQVRKVTKETLESIKKNEEK